MVLCDFNRKGFDLAGPQRDHTIPHSGQRKAANAVKQTTHGDLSHFDTAWITVFVALTAD